MEEKFEGPLDIDHNLESQITTVAETLRKKNTDFGLVVTSAPWPDWFMWQNIDGECVRAVTIIAFSRNNDKLLFFIPHMGRFMEKAFAMALPNEQSLLFPLEALSKLNPDEQKRVILALLEAAWKEAKKLDENDVVELLEKK